MEQAKRYAKSVPDSIGSWRGYQVPFLYSTNGETIFSWDARHEKNLPQEILDFHLPQALWDRYQQDRNAALQFFHKVPVPMGPEDRIRDYQVEAIRAVEQGLEDGRRKMLVAMATGTGKTFTTISLIYRLLKSGYAKRILFLVDRRALADKLEAHYHRAMARIEKFPQAILAKAFRGELVPQDPNDEPAEKLLERIRQERAGMEKVGRAKKKPLGKPKRAKAKAMA
jgi:type I site-specific restriction endonuclease